MNAKRQPKGLSLMFESTQYLPIFCVFPYDGHVYQVTNRVMNCYFAVAVIDPTRALTANLDLTQVIWLKDATDLDLT